MISFHLTNPSNADDDIQALMKAFEENKQIVSVEPYQHLADIRVGIIIDPQNNLDKMWGATRVALFDAALLQCKQGLMSATSYLYQFPIALDEDVAVFVGELNIDSIAACALLYLQHYKQYQQLDDIKLDDDQLDLRVHTINQSDCRLWLSDWNAGRKELSEAEYRIKCELDPLIAIQAFAKSPKNDDELRTVVRKTLTWLLTGVEPDGYHEKAVTEKIENYNSCELIAVIGEDHNAIAVVHVLDFDCISYAYEYAPYAIAYNPVFTQDGKQDPHLKYAIGCYNPRQFYFPATKLVDAFNVTEVALGAEFDPAWNSYSLDLIFSTSKHRSQLSFTEASLIIRYVCGLRWIDTVKKQSSTYKACNP